MENMFSESSYEEMLQNLFVRFPSFQKVGAGAYKPGIANMEFADQLMGHPHHKYKIIHVAGTNGKGSVSNMLASVLAASGHRVGLYTSPHILDFRERIRLVYETRTGGCAKYEYISKNDVWDFVSMWKETFDHLDLSFFEITTLMAFDWFAKARADVVVLETGLGGRLDSTNIVTPILSVITNIGLDHCDLLGDTLAEIAFEKAGIIKPGVPAVVGESHPETDVVFERKVLYVNLPEPKFMGNRNAVMSLLTFADKVEPPFWGEREGILAAMDLKGAYQCKNLRTVLSALDVLSAQGVLSMSVSQVKEAIIHTADRTGFRGRWEKLSDSPFVICDIGHNEHGLKYNFRQLQQMIQEGECSHLIVLFGAVADKDVEAVIHLMPGDAVYVFTMAGSKRALSSGVIDEKYKAFCAVSGMKPSDTYVTESVREGLAKAYELSSAIKESFPDARPLIYIGGSTYVVAEAVESIALSCAESI